MGAPLYERAVAKLAELAASCTTENGYDFNVVEVVRPTAELPPVYDSGVVAVVTGDVEREDQEQEANTGLVTFRVAVELHVWPEVVEDRPADESAAIAAGEVYRALRLHERLAGFSGPISGHVDGARLVRISRRDVEESGAVGVTLAVELLIAMNESDLGSGR